MYSFKYYYWQIPKEENCQCSLPRNFQNYTMTKPRNVGQNSNVNKIVEIGESKILCAAKSENAKISVMPSLPIISTLGKFHKLILPLWCTQGMLRMYIRTAKMKSGNTGYSSSSLMKWIFFLGSLKRSHAINPFSRYI